MVKMFCVKCGTEMGEDDRFCKKCGKDFVAQKISETLKKTEEPSPSKPVYNGNKPNQGSFKYKNIGIGIIAIIVIGIIVISAGGSSIGAPLNVVVNNASGSSTPGCEPECFIPSTVTIRTGGTVTWENNDTAAHTATTGSPTEGPSGMFDSSLIMAGSSSSHTFEEAGSYDYFCMVHPWMTGVVVVR